jgi:hypothetical protein
MSNTAAILKDLDKKAVLKYLITEDKSTFEVGGVDTATYTVKFQERNGYSLEQIEKSLTDQGITEVNEETVSKVMGLIEVSKSSEVAGAAQGIILSLIQNLQKLYYVSNWRLNTFTEKFTDPDTVYLINAFLAWIKITMDDLRFVTFNAGQIATVPVKTIIAKCYDDYGYYDSYSNRINTWQVEEINETELYLSTCMLSLDSLLKIFPDSEEFKGFKQSLQSCFDTIVTFNANFKDIVILANEMDIIRVSEKPATAKEQPVIFYDQVGKRHVATKPIRKMQVIQKNIGEIEGRITMLVAEPETKDADGNFMSEEVIAKMHYDFMINYQQFDIMHNLQVLKSDKTDPERQVALLQSTLTRQPETFTVGDTDITIKKGSFIVELQYFDKEIVKKFASGEYNGGSLYGGANIDPTDLEPIAV